MSLEIVKLICIKTDKDNYLFEGEVYYTNVPPRVYNTQEGTKVYVTYRDKNCESPNGFMNCDNFKTLEEIREEKLNLILSNKL